MLKSISALPLMGFIVLIEPLQAIAQQAPQPPSLPPQWYWHGPHFWWICPLMLLMFFVLCGIFFCVRGSCFGNRRHWRPPWHMMDRGWDPPTHSAIQILNERFAKGEIQQDEYEDKKAAILSGGQH